VVESSNEFSAGGAMPSSEFAGGVAGPDACTESGAPLDIAQVLESVGATAYRWDFNTDTIEWDRSGACRRTL
jgi:hypothetical protein